MPQPSRPAHSAELAPFCAGARPRSAFALAQANGNGAAPIETASGPDRRLNSDVTCCDRLRRNEGSYNSARRDCPAHPAAWSGTESGKSKKYTALRSDSLRQADYQRRERPNEARLLGGPETSRMCIAFKGQQPIRCRQWCLPRARRHRPHGPRQKSRCRPPAAQRRRRYESCAR